MSVDPLSPDIRTFIAQHVRSLRGLELLLLVQAKRDRDWTAKELSDELRATPQWVDQELRFFEAHGLVIQASPESPKYRYAPLRANLENMVAELSTIYPVRPMAVIEAIFSSTRGSIRNFADAFRLRKEKPDG